MRMRSGLASVVGLAIALALCSSGTAAGAVFTDATTDAGLVYVQHATQSPPACVIDFPFCQVDRMTGGAAVDEVRGLGGVDLGNAHDDPDARDQGDERGGGERHQKRGKPG